MGFNSAFKGLRKKKIKKLTSPICGINAELLVSKKK
jgi:hypothetical protein